MRTVGITGRAWEIKETSDTKRYVSSMLSSQEASTSISESSSRLIKYALANFLGKLPSTSMEVIRGHDVVSG